MKTFSIFSCFFSVLFSFSQGLNLDFQGSIDYDNTRNTRLSDVWGYVDEQGNEYGLVGARKGVAVVDVTDPANPVEVFWHPDTESVWRDLKTWGDYAYITTEANSGLLIIDLSPLPDNPITVTTNFFGHPGQTWATAHNLYIDENGYCYIFGSNRGNGGVIIYDVATDPMNPIEVGEFDNWYVHDGFVRNNIMYLGHIYEGTFSLVDVTDKANPILLGTQTTSSNFAHNIWPSDDGNYVFTTDEVSNAFIDAYDVSDPFNMFLTDKIQSNPGTATVPHNAHVLGNFLITSYYADGVTVHDISDPYNLVEVGNYDTHPGTSTNTTGCWGAYPFLPSGNLLVTDIQTGFYVLTPDYKLASKLEGNIVNALSLNPVNGVEVAIQSSNQLESSDLLGEYKAGTISEGLLDVTYTKYGYEPQMIPVNFVNATTVTQDVQLVPIAPFNFKVIAQDDQSNPLVNASVRVEHNGVILEALTNGLGEASFELYYFDDYAITVGKWGYVSNCQTVFLDQTLPELTIGLPTGYYDDFSFDFGWSAFGDASAGLWERALPVYVEIGGGVSSNPSQDSEGDCEVFAYVTGNAPTASDNVTDGTVTLVSPVWDATIYTDPYVYYERWFFNFLGDFAPDDTIRVVLSNGTDMVEIDKEGSEFNQLETWVPVSKRIADYLTPTNTMQLFVNISDLAPKNNATEGGFDNFRVTEGAYLTINKEELTALTVYPNPFSSFFVVEGMGAAQFYQITDMKGAVLLDGVTQSSQTKINTGQLPSGMYLLRVGEEVVKLVKYD